MVISSAMLVVLDAVEQEVIMASGSGSGTEWTVMGEFSLAGMERRVSEVVGATCVVSVSPPNMLTNFSVTCVVMDPVKLIVGVAVTVVS